jgi:hypothetical protein
MYASSLKYKNIYRFHNIRSGFLNLALQGNPLKQLLTISLLCVVLHCIAQTVHSKGDTVFANNKPCALLKQTHVVPPTYTIENLKRETLVKIYPGKIFIKGRQCYIVTFMNDKRQSALAEVKDIVNKLAVELIKSNVIKDGAIDKAAEEKFIKKHPVPKGYEDVEQMSEYGVRMGYLQKTATPDE